MRTIINKFKNLIEHGRVNIYHFEHNKEAMKLLKIVEEDKGTLDSKNKKICKEYAQDVFGHVKFAPWLYVYCAYAGEFREGWIPDNFYGEVVVPQLNGEYGSICNRNAVINNLLKNEINSLDIAYYVNKLILNTHLEILNLEKLKDILFAENEKIVYKLENSRQGTGVYFFDKTTFNFNIINQLGNGVFQKYIEQHDFFSEFNMSAVATIRITSVCDDNGNTEARAGYFRFGRENDTHVISKRQMRIPIDIKSGQLGERVFFPDSRSSQVVPDNDIPFANKTLPIFDECLKKVKKAHGLIPFIRCIGWDIIVDKENIIRFIELNGGHNGITFNEMVQGPCFKGLNWEKLI